MSDNRQSQQSAIRNWFFVYFGRWPRGIRNARGWLRRRSKFSPSPPLLVSPSQMLALALLLPSPAYMRWRYKPRPAWLWPLYYPYRWLDILREGLSTLWRIGKGKVENGEWIMDDGKGKMDGVRVEGGKGKTERGKGG